MRTQGDRRPAVINVSTVRCFCIGLEGSSYVIETYSKLDLVYMDS